MDKLDSVWSYPWDATHTNDTDINLLLLSQQPENKQQFEDMVNNRWAMRQNWITILEELGIPLQDPAPRFDGYKHPKSIQLSHWIRSNKAACRRLIHNPEVRDLEYRFFPMVYLDKILASGKESQFRELASMSETSTLLHITDKELARVDDLPKWVHDKEALRQMPQVPNPDDDFSRRDEPNLTQLRQILEESLERGKRLEDKVDRMQVNVDQVLDRISEALKRTEATLCDKIDVVRREIVQECDQLASLMRRQSRLE